MVCHHEMVCHHAMACHPAWQVNEVRRWRRAHRVAQTEDERNFADNWIGILENDGLLPAGSTKAPEARDAFAREIRAGMRKGMLTKYSQLHLKANT